jgi:hypothetical protein
MITRYIAQNLFGKYINEVLVLKLGKLQRLKEFDLSDASVKAIMKNRYHGKIPAEETVISPGSLFDSELLVTVLKK